MACISYADAYSAIQDELVQSTQMRVVRDQDYVQELPALQSFLATEYRGVSKTERPNARSVSLDNGGTSVQNVDGFKRMEKCRMALDALDNCGWKRSYFQVRVHYSGSYSYVMLKKRLLCCVER